MSIVKSLYATRDWHISGESKEISNWLTACLKNIWDKFINDSMTAMEYGFFAGVKDFYLGDDGKYWIKSIKPLKPHYLTILADSVGDYAGVKQDFNEGLEKEAYTKTYEAKDTILYSYNSKFNDFYGNSRLLAARYPYVTYKYIIEMTNIFYENYISPAKIGRAPQGKGKTKDGVEKFNIDIMSEKIQEMALGGAKDITLPSETDEKGNPRWDIKLLESSRTGADYIEYLKFLEQKMSHGVLVPELAFAQTGSGSYNLFDGQESFLAYKSDLDMAQFADCVKEQIINQLLDLNFGSEHIGKYTLEFTKASRKDRELSKMVVQALAQNMGIDFDYEQLSRMTGLKITKNIIETAKGIEDIKKGKATKTIETVEKEEEKKTEQLELPLNEMINFGGEGSGNFDHAGRPGEVGGSSSFPGSFVSHEDVVLKKINKPDFNEKGEYVVSTSTIEIVNGKIQYTTSNLGTDLQLRERAAKELNKIVEDDIRKGEFYRATNNPKEKPIISKNYATNKSEAGMSVSKSPHYGVHGYKYIYKVSGNIIGTGSDGEPLLDISSVKRTSKNIPAKKAMSDWSQKANKIINSIGKIELELPLCGCSKVHMEKEKRSFTPVELRVNFSKINDIYNNAPAIERVMADMWRRIQSLVLSKAEKPYTAGDVSKMKLFTLDNKAKYENEYITELTDTYKKAFDTVVDELKLSKTYSTSQLDLAALKLQQQAQKQISDVEFGIKSLLLGGMSKGVPFSDLTTQVNDYFNDYINNKMTFGVQASIQEMVDDGRADGADDPLVELAQYSAILDEDVCPLCLSLDMMVVSVDSPEYKIYSPSNMHPNCRCVWIYILKDEKDKPPVDFVKPSDELINKYMRR
jgi:hypothetical protein